MNKQRAKVYYMLVTSLILSISLISGGCAQKAKMVQTGAAQFEVESLAAINKIDELSRKETEATSFSPEEASDFFVKAVKNSQKKITRKSLRTLLDPLALDMPMSKAKWQDFIQKMRTQYTTLTATFTSLDKGSLLAASEVKRTVPILDKLIAQLVAFSSLMKDHPAEFIRERAAIAEEIERIRGLPPNKDEIKDLKLREAEKRLRETESAEKQITREAMEHALKAATIGIELRKLLLDYEKVTIDDIAEGLSIAFSLAGSIPGLNLSGLEAKTGEFINTINADPSLREFFDTALSEISEVSTTREAERN